MHEFNRASAEAPSKRKRTDSGIIFENGKDIGESMYQSLVNRPSQMLSGQTDPTAI